MAEQIFAELADLIVDTARELRIRAGVVARGVPLNQTQSHVMRFVHRNPGCSPSAIASGTGLQRANVSVAISELRDLGYLVTRRHESDGRSLVVQATMHAEDTLRRLREAWGELLEHAWGDDESRLDADLLALSDPLERILGSLIASRPRGNPVGGSNGESPESQRNH